MSTTRVVVGVGSVAVFGLVLALAVLPHTVPRTDGMGTELRPSTTIVQVDCNGRLFTDPGEVWLDRSPGTVALPGTCELSEGESRGVILALVLSGAALALVGLALAWRASPPTEPTGS